MKAAIIGLPRSGKSTVFTAVTGAALDPYAAPKPHPAVVHLREPRLDFLTDLTRPKKVTEATLDLVDIPGCSLDDPKGREDWRHLLPEVRLADLLVAVIRDFEDPSVPAYRDRVDAVADFDEVWSEIIFSDLEGVTARIEKLEKALKKPTGSHETEKHELALLTRCREALEAEKPLSSAFQTHSERALLAAFAFLTEKPLVCVRNVSDDRVATAEPLKVEHSAVSLTLCASIEAEIAQLDAADRPAFLADLGLEVPAGERLVLSCHEALGLISFFTMNPEEVRAWTVPKGTTAVEAAGKVHTDFARGFIRAETVAYDELVACGDMKSARAAGKVRKEGKGYVVADGDVLYILSGT